MIQYRKDLITLFKTVEKWEVFYYELYDNPDYKKEIIKKDTIKEYPLDLSKCNYYPPEIWF